METAVSRTFIIELTALAVLAGFLCVSVYLRRRETRRQRREDLARARDFRRRWRPTALDTSSIQRQIDNVRRDYTVPVHYQARHAGYRSRLISLIQSAISQLSYFQSAGNRSRDPNEQEAHNRA